MRQRGVPLGRLDQIAPSMTGDVRDDSNDCLGRDRHRQNPSVDLCQEVEANAASQLDELWWSHLLTRDTSWSITPGEVTTRSEIQAKFGGATQGGIQPSATTANIMLFTDPDAGRQHGYDFDGWSATEPGIYYYTGEGQGGRPARDSQQSSSA
jgi:hypothetical protein